MLLDVFMGWGINGVLIFRCWEDSWEFRQHVGLLGWVYNRE